MIYGKIDKSKNSIQVVNPITGKIEDVNLCMILKEIEPYETELQSQLDIALADLAKANALNEFLENKISGLSIKDYEDYNSLKVV